MLIVVKEMLVVSWPMKNKESAVSVKHYFTLSHITLHPFILYVRAVHERGREGEGPNHNHPAQPQITTLSGPPFHPSHSGPAAALRP